MIYWFYMLLAIVFEVAGTVAMKYTADGEPLLGFLIMYLMLIFSYTFLALAVKKIPMAVAYGAWESLGLVIISLISAAYFAEPLTQRKVLAIGLLIIGIFFLEHGTSEKPAAASKL